MRILLINHEFPPIGGGAATITRELFLRFEKAGHDIHLLTGSHPLKNPKITSVRTGRKSHAQGSIPEFLRFIIFGIIQLRRIHRKFQPDVVIAFFTLPGGIVARFNKRIFKTPYLVSVRGGDMPGFQLGRKHEIFQWLANPFIRKVCRSSDRVHCNSKRLYDLTLQNAIDPDKIQILPNGIDCQVCSDRDNVVSERIKLLFTGRLSQQKNLATFLKALVSLPFDYRFTIIGNGPEQKKLMEFSQAHHLSIEFIDWKSREELNRLYQEYNVFILPSLDEGMSNSALEAVAHQCALLASKNACLQWEDEELLKDWVVEDYLNPEAWKKCLENIYNKLNNINKISKVMKDFVIRNNRWDALFPKYEEMVRKCVE
ncbi:MAG: glycosyltransferase family 4 protein [Candidatus Marinimicrobia bacterium]|nr:glycosyltransferase family 4 protein [Candidatus Neomarinimicrobiota bacterium]